MQRGGKIFSTWTRIIGGGSCTQPGELVGMEPVDDGSRPHNPHPLTPKFMSPTHAQTIPNTTAAKATPIRNGGPAEVTSKLLGGAGVGKLRITPKSSALTCTTQSK